MFNNFSLEKLINCLESKVEYITCFSATAFFIFVAIVLIKLVVLFLGCFGLFQSILLMCSTGGITWWGLIISFEKLESEPKKETKSDVELYKNNGDNSETKNDEESQ